MRILISCLAIVGLTACSMIQTHPQRRHFQSPHEVAFDPQAERRSIEFNEVRRELGLDRTRDLSDFQIQAINDRVQLHQAEERLSSEAEKVQYFQYKPFFANDRERLRFLELRGFSEKENYARSLGIAPSSDQITQQDKDAAQESDLFLGMSKAGVRLSWGEPKIIDVAGAQIYGNERWTYSDYVPSPDGFILENRLIYFEGGRVVGWERR